MMMGDAPTGPRPTLTAADLAEASEDDALALVATQLAPLLSSSNPVVRQLVEKQFHRDWQVEAGRWLLFAQRHGFLDAVVKQVIGAAEAPPDAQNTHRDRFFRTFLAWLAEPMAAYFFVRSGWGFGEWEPPRFKPVNDVDFILASPGAAPRDVLVQVKSPDVPGEVVGGRAFGGDNDEHVWLAVGGGVLESGKRKKGAIGQLPSPAATPAMIVVHAHRHGSLAFEPSIETKLVGATVQFESGRVTLPRNRRGAFFTPEWSHCGAVVLLDNLRGAEEFLYTCTVFINPNAEAAARCEREWFRGARVNYLDGDTFRWQAGAPEYSTIPDGTTLLHEDI